MAPLIFRVISPILFLTSCIPRRDGFAEETYNIIMHIMAQEPVNSLFNLLLVELGHVFGAEVVVTCQERFAFSVLPSRLMEILVAVALRRNLTISG